MIIAGLKRYGYNNYVRQVATGLFEATLYLENGRLPELFCGFTRSPGHGSTPYPIACSPQAWSAASIFSIFSSLLGLTADAVNHRLYFISPTLPSWLKWVEVKNLRVGKERIDFIIREGKVEASVEVTSKTENIEIITRR